MRHSHSAPRKTTRRDDRDGEVLVNDISKYLSGLAKLHEDEKTGNIELSRGLRDLVRALRPFANLPVSDLSAALAGTANLDSIRATPLRPKAELPPRLESLSHEDIGRVLGDGDYTKEQIAELGARRFGISRSKLVRQRKDDARESVRAALANERALDVISEEARRAGRARAI